MFPNSILSISYLIMDPESDRVFLFSQPDPGPYSFYVAYLVATTNIVKLISLALSRDIAKPWLGLVLVSFGDHLLHHLFPAVDHSRLAQLYPGNKRYIHTKQSFGFPV